MNSTANFVSALKWKQQPNHPWMNVLFHTGLVTTIVMMKTTLLNVDLMVVIAVEMMSMTSTANFVNVLKWKQQPNHPWVNVLFHTGLATTIVMMKTTPLNVDLMVETAVETMSILPTAPNVNVLISQRQLKPQMDPNVLFHTGLVTTIVMMKTITLIVVLMVETVVEMMLTLPTALNAHVLNNYILYFQRIVA